MSSDELWDSTGLGGEMSLTNVERDILANYENLSLPRHTSYPPVSYWLDDAIQAQACFARALSGQSQVPEIRGIASELAEIYVHIPFCEKLCLYCACNRVTLPREEDKAGQVSLVLDLLEKEARALASIKGLRASRVHFGGGTPNYLSGSELKRIVDAIRSSVRGSEQSDFSIEIDVRHLKLSFLSALKDCGFQYASLGIQELDPEIQEKIGRVQTVDQIMEAVSCLREYGVSNINFDLIYGLPGQSLESWKTTLARCVQMSPSRFSLFRFALMPQAFPWQKVLLNDSHSVPNGIETANMFLWARDYLSNSGYEYIGLDHFAKSDDPLARAAQRGSLGRSFQGVVEKERVQIIGLGPSAVSFFGGVYAQREKDIKKWLKLDCSGDDGVKTLTSSLVRYFELTPRDWSRFKIIQEIYANGFIAEDDLLHEDASFPLHPSSPIRARYIEQGVLASEFNGLRLSDRLGKLLSRLIASHFDDYFSGHTPSVGRHSKAF